MCVTSWQYAGWARMSVQALSWVLEHSDAQYADRLVLISLADHAQSDGTGAWPSVETIARHAKISRRAALYSLSALEEQGAIVRTGKSRQGTVVWTVVMTVQQTLDGGADIARADIAPVQSVTSRGAGSAPDPSENHPSTPPLTPPSRGGATSRRSRRVNGQGFDPDAALDEVTLHAYRRMGVQLPDGATQADAERAVA